jgi:Sulfotransferase family
VPPIFVGGLNRSGTTLLARILGSHSCIAVPPTELLFFGHGWHRPLAGRDEFERRLREILDSRRVREWGLDREEVLARSREVEPTPRSLFTLVLDAHRRTTGKPRLGEKSVLNELRLDVFDRWFGDFRLLQMVRNPLTTWASARGGGGPSVSRALDWARVWAASAALALRAERERPARHMVVRYEDLLEDPASLVGSICSFVVVPAQVERMLDLPGYDDKENSSFGDAALAASYEGAIRRRDGIDRVATVPSSERRAIAHSCAELARALGYDLRPPSPRAAYAVVYGAALGLRRARRAASIRLDPY